MEHDKYKECLGCPDRVADPNCHDTCPGNIARMEEKARENAERRKDIEFNSCKIDLIYRTNKKAETGQFKKRNRGKIYD